MTNKHKVLFDKLAIPTREQVMEFFRNDDSLNELNDCDRQEIALACASNLDDLYIAMENIFLKY